MDHLIEISPLTKKKPENPDYVERFELSSLAEKCATHTQS